ncbi:DUF6215 domain-containing protein [Kitasatospora sp. NPDC058162]|uniref:DUF6215 domain-containing protein n=1 Tax=Kitasatospora sp. NPDC058162 TaxID=3346362 RepID=UPI0036DF0C23
METDERNNTDGRNNTAVIAAVAMTVLAGGLVVALMQVDALKPHPAPARCPQAAASDPAGDAVFCAALNRRDLPELLGTPGDQAAEAGRGTVLGDDHKDARAEVRLRDTVVSLSESSRSAASVGSSSTPDNTQVTVLGHRAATTWDTTVTLFGPKNAPSPKTRNLVIAKDPKDPGGKAFEIAVFRQDGGMVDDAVVQRVAEAVVPNLPGWVAAP